MKKSNFFFALFVITSFASSAQICFSPANNFDADGQSGSIISVDFNNDGKLDLATANGYSNNVSILLGTGSGYFFSHNIAVGTNPISVTSADFNGDGKMDLATANSTANGNNVSVLLGDGLGWFSPATNFALSFYPYSVISADFNGDGKMDLATSIGSNVSVLLGNGSGGFSMAVDYWVGAHTVSVTSADFNGDGKIDLATANDIANNVSILFGNGLGGFSAATNFAVGTSPIYVTSADFNGDGKMDLATANRTGNNVSVLLGNGLGGFSAATNFTVGTDPNSVTVADFNGDGKMDLAAANLSSNNVSVLLGNGSGNFSTATNFAVGTSPLSVTSADFNGDSKMDLATTINTASDNVSVLLGLLTFTVSKTNVTCNGGTNGSATATVSCGSPPYSYSWNTSPIQTTATATGLSAGTYTVIVTDADNASKTVSVTITQPVLPIVSSTPNSKCSGVCNGTAKVWVSGSAVGYTYQWNASANNQTTATASSLCQGNYSVIVKDANLCSVTLNVEVTLTTVVDTNIYLTNLAAVDQINVSPSFAAYYTYNLPASITAPPSNPRNFVDPGKKARFKVECTNKKISGQSIVSGICKVRTNNPYITITDSSSALNNIGWNNKAWSADEFEINIDANTPPGTNAYIDFIVQESGQEYATTCIAIPITPLVYSPTTPFTIDDDNNPDSQGNDNDTCEANETIEFYPWLDNISTLNAEYVRGRFENLDNLSYINIWNNVPGVGTTVYDATWWNYSFAQPQTINANDFNTTPEYDFVFKYINTNIINDFKLYMVMAGGFKLFSGNALSLVQWTLPYTFNSTGVISIGDELDIKDGLIIYPNPSTDFIIIKNKNDKSNSNYSIINSLGQQMLTGKLTSETTSVDISLLQPGFYLLQIGEDEKQTVKLVKK